MFKQNNVIIKSVQKFHGVSYLLVMYFFVWELLWSKLDIPSDILWLKTEFHLPDWCQLHIAFHQRATQLLYDVPSKVWALALKFYTYVLVGI